MAVITGLVLFNIAAVGAALWMATVDRVGDVQAAPPAAAATVIDAAPPAIAATVTGGQAPRAVDVPRPARLAPRTAPPLAQSGHPHVHEQPVPDGEGDVPMIPVAHEEDGTTHSTDPQTP
jgi:hypothetical protein